MKVKDRSIQISVVGAGSASDKILEIAERVGELLAERGCIIINGGLGGVMEAVSKGARRKGGIVVGILPNMSEGNEYLSVRIKTNMGHARNVIIAQSGDAVIAIGGGYGTLSEIAIALKTGKKVVAIKPPAKVKGLIVAENAEDAVKKLFENLV